MLSCWSADPKERSPFSDLVNTIEFILTTVADYLDINEFPLILKHDSEGSIDNMEKNVMVDILETPQ